MLLGQLRDWRDLDFTTLFLPYVAKLSVEIGKMEQASSILDSAEALSSKYPDYNYNKPVLLRERAAFYYASGRYKDAVKAAAKAYGLSQEQNTDARSELRRWIGGYWKPELGRSRNPRLLLRPPSRVLP